MDSSTASSDVSHTWASGEVGGAFDIFYGEGSASYDQLTTQFAAAGVQVHASFKSVLQFAAGPLGQPSSDPVLSGYTPWYYSPALNLAYHTSDNTVWQHGNPSWADTFGPTGDMQRVCSALIVVDGISVTVTSSAQFSSSDQQTFTYAASGGFWPFFEASSSGGWSSTATFSDSGEATVTITSPAGNPQILGCIVTPISSIVANQEAIIQFAAIEQAAVAGKR